MLKTCAKRIGCESVDSRLDSVAMITFRKPEQNLAENPTFDSDF